MRSLLLFAICALTAAMPAKAAVLNWNSAPGNTWTAGSTSQSFDVDASNPGNDITVSIVATAPWTANFPQVVQNGPSVVGNNDQNYLQLRTPGMGNSSNGFTVTITFNYVGGVYANLALIDVDKQTGTWIDRIEAISAQSAAGATVPLTVTGSAANTVTGSGTLAATLIGSTVNITDHSGDGSLDTNGVKVTSLTFKWSNPGPDFGGQVIAFTNIVFVTTPEVGSSLGALLLCGGAAAFMRRRTIQVAA